MTNILNPEDPTLVVGDVHIAAKQNLVRADWLGKAIKDIKPKRIVYIGDLITLDVFSAWDKDKRKLMEGRRYTAEMNTANEFLDRVKRASGNYKCDMILTEGNHEHRQSRYIDTHPEIDGAIDYKRDLDILDWNIVPYKSYFNFKGVGFTHIPISEAGKPIGGKYVTHKALELHQGSTIFGHTHKLQVTPLHRHGARHLNQALNVGCYFTHIDDYALGAVTSYWRGLILIDHYKHSRFGWQPISMGKLKRTYRKTKGK